MFAPVLCARTDRSIGAVVLTVSGPLTTCEHVAALRKTLEMVPPGYSLIIELDAMTTLSSMGLGCLRDLAHDAIRQGTRLVLVSESLDVRANLVLNDLDSLAPVLHNLRQARQVVAAAA